MEDKAQCRAQLSKSIAQKVDSIAQLRDQLDTRKKTCGNGVDEQIVVAELEYRLVKEEMALLTLQEQHWESAALPHPSDPQRDVCEVLHSYIVSVKENGSIPALHASDHLHPDNSVLVSSRGDRPSLPRVEWAHHSTDLQAGDRLLEVNGRLVIGKDSSEVTRLLNSCRPSCRIVFLRPLHPYQLLKGGGACRETARLRHELTSVVGRLNRQMAENTSATQRNDRLLKECEELRSQNRQLQLQVLSLQSLLLYLHQSNTLTPSCVYDLLHKFTLQGPGRKSIPWKEEKEGPDNT